MVRRARLNPAGLHWEQFVVGERDGRAVGVAQLRRHPDGARELASLVVDPGARGHGIAAQMVDALLAGETAAVYALIDRRFTGHFARWDFRQVAPSELPRSVSRTYLIGRAVTTLGSLLRRQRIRIVPVLRPRSLIAAGEDPQGKKRRRAAGLFIVMPLTGLWMASRIPAGAAKGQVWPCCPRLGRRRGAGIPRLLSALHPRGPPSTQPALCPKPRVFVLRDCSLALVF